MYGKQNRSEICSVLCPRQLGFGRPGGMDGTDDANSSVLVKLDFANAFNTLRRDGSSYGRPSDLFYDDIVMSSSSGVQQGDPLGPPSSLRNEGVCRLTGRTAQLVVPRRWDSRGRA